ncbi:MAG: cytochrome c biogenesis CcdA family protein [Acidimicrobiales bacterium]
MIDAPIALAFGAGMIATVNPCGFAMLPAYLSYFLGLEDTSADAEAGVLRALAVAGTVSAGFLVVFSVVGLLITQFSLSIEQHLPWVTIVIGAGLLVLGVAMLRGFSFTVSLPKLNKGTESRTLGSMFLFGVSYAIASLSCTIPVFLATLSSTLSRSSFLSALVVFLAYALGMALVLGVLTLAIALARHSIVRRMKGFMRYVNPISGVLLVLAGLYLAYYGWYELRVYGGETSGGGPARVVFDLNSRISDWVQSVGATRIGIVLAGVIAFVVIVSIGLRVSRPERDETSDHASS